MIRVTRSCPDRPSSKWQGRHRSCSSRRAKLTERPAELRTLEGQDNVPGQTYTVTKDKVECYNSKNPQKPEHPYRWVDANVTCRDWKIRYVDSDALSTGDSSHSGAKLRDWANRQAEAGCYSWAALSSNDSKTR